MIQDMHATTRHLKEKAIEEFRLYLIVFAYLALMLGAFTTYRRLILAQAGITYAHYGAGIIEAAVVAKVILIGQALGVGKRLETQPVLVSVFVKSILYALLVAAFGVVEHLIEGLWHGGGWSAAMRNLLVLGPHELLARAMVVIVSFLPFFALWEVGRVLGPGKLNEIFLSRRQSVG